MASKILIGIYIENPEIFRKLVRKLKSRKLSFTAELNIENPNTTIVITDVPEKIKGKVKILSINCDEDIDAIVEQTSLLSKGSYLYNVMLIGIDPGINTGLAIIGDGTLIKGDVYRNINTLIKEIKHVLNTVPFLKCRIRIGYKSKFSTKILEELLKIEKNNIVLEIVDEKETSKPPIMLSLKTSKLPKDVMSAINIAFKRGVEVSKNAKRNSDSRKRPSA